MTMLLDALAFRILVTNNGPAMFSVELDPCVQVEPPVEPVIPPAPEDVTIPLFVTVMFPTMAIVPETDRFAVDKNVFAAVIDSPLEFVIDPLPSILAAPVLSVISPEPLNVPLTVKFPC